MSWRVSLLFVCLIVLMIPTVGRGANLQSYEESNSSKVVPMGWVNKVQPSVVQLQQVANNKLQSLVKLCISDSEAAKLQESLQSVHGSVGYNVLTDEAIRKALNIVANKPPQPIVADTQPQINSDGIEIKLFDLKHEYDKVCEHQLKPWLLVLSHTAIDYMRKIEEACKPSMKAPMTLASSGQR